MFGQCGATGYERTTERDMKGLDERTILRLCAYVDQELGDRESREVERLLADDAEARRFVAAMRSVNRELRQQWDDGRRLVAE